MAIYPNYSQTSQPNIPQIYPPQQVIQQPCNMQGGLIWVQGEMAAKSWPVPAGTTAVLWDTETSTIYLKSADMSGMPSMKVLDYTIRGMEENNTLYVTKEDFVALKKDIDEIKSRLKHNKKNQNGGMKDESTISNVQ